MTVLEAPDQPDELSRALAGSLTGGIDSDVRFGHQRRLTGVGGHGPAVPIGTVGLAL